jgi:hypothetical protein
LIAPLAALAVSNCSLRSLRSLCPIARSARCDVRWGAAVFVGSDETIVSQIDSVFDAFRRLLLQIGGANIAGADRVFGAAYFVVSRGRKSVFPRSSSARRRAIRGTLNLVPRDPWNP